eukprot:m.49153 g.49153  ORF g.49153 m.49153 type:complete len:104 (-) comp12454_c0_seq1:427-738(-)
MFIDVLHAVLLQRCVSVHYVSQKEMISSVEDYMSEVDALVRSAVRSSASKETLLRAAKAFAATDTKLARSFESINATQESLRNLQESLDAIQEDLKQALHTSL